MLTFLAIAAKKRLSVISYSDDAVGYLENDAAGQLCLTRVELHPEVTWGQDVNVTDEQYRKLHASAHDNCFIANSVRSEVSVVYD